jgi:hypothetical protein
VVYLLGWIALVVVGWVVLLVTMLAGRRIIDMSFPPFRDFLWKAAVVVSIPSAMSILLGFVIGWVGNLAACIVYVVLMRRLFELDLWQIIAISLINTLVSWLIIGAIIAAFLVAKTN